MAFSLGPARRVDWGYIVVLLGLWALLSAGIWQQLALPLVLCVFVAALAAVLHGLVCRSAFYLAKVTPVRRSSSALASVGRLGGATLLAGALLTVLCLALIASLPVKEVSLEPLAPWLFATGAGTYLLSLAYFYGTLARAEAASARQAAASSQALAKDARLAELMARLSPHFLFNALSSIAALLTLDPGRAREMVVELAEFMRSRLHAGAAELVPLLEELEIARHYLAIEKMRLAERLTFEEVVDKGAVTSLVPALLIQPLLENAIKHGIAPREEGGVVHLSAQAEAGRLRLVIRNPVERHRRPRPTTRDGLGLELVRRRLEAHYGSRAFVRVDRDPGQFRVTIELPLSNERP